MDQEHTGQLWKNVNINMIIGVMMTEIKFRFWDSENKSMSDPKTLAHLPARFKKKRYIPMVFSGLKDSSGKEICEGDVLRCERTDSKEVETVIVKRSPGQFSVYNPNCCERCKNDDGCISYLSDFVCFTESWKIKIIGNMYENQELIKKCGYENQLT